ncbi:sugar ABC transporter ATP-binding protein [Desulfosporosinus youngiae]|uniref:ABC-type sugar transport system, ATPase component n=1 Tax=Desulfosporosinus youngiae DSM 17734 TaxID=768710 RepID=H5Y0F4_9FIRM|nr:ATP-binding cassette domain-containing protein [Desulfosporosinus youngiae]EHQ92210.1 ABC-type sugar transport system, ATPase component [Desulfosporosinus youngiae DSM 17734]
MQKPLLFLKSIHKEFPGVKALRGVDFTLEKGQIVSLVGTNGAGKSTLSSIIAGICTPDQGEVFIEGNKVTISDPNVAEELGIGIVHQEPTLVPNMTVVENIFLNKEITRKGIVLDKEKMKQESLKVLEFLGFQIDVDKKVEDLSLVEKEVVEIAKAMFLKPKILILDEVTAPLNKSEVDHLFKIMKDLKANGMGIIFIGHKLQEIIEISDSIVVFRDGKNVGELMPTGELSEKEIIALMLGVTLNEDLGTGEQDPEFEQGQEVLNLVNLTKHGIYKDISFKLNKGELVGFAGLKGSGITELLLSIQGIDTFDEGEMYVKSKRVKFKNPKDGIDSGIGMITNDRQKEGLALTLDVKENIAVSSLEYICNKLKLIDTKTLKENAQKYVKALSIKTPTIHQFVQNLSGGNQQKIVIAKWLLRDLDIILVDEPTRGVDVKAKNEIYKLLINEKNNGKSLLVASPEIRELLSICDKILIVINGSIVSEVRRNTREFNEEDILNIIHSADHH